MRPVPAPRCGEVLIKVEACGVCRGDALIDSGAYPGLSYPRIPGHEVVGTLDTLGADVTGWREGARVGVGWHGGHCFHCAPCRRGEFNACLHAQTTGLSVDGGYAEYMITRAEALVHMPPDIDALRAAPLLCAGNTVYGALINCGAQPGELVAIHGLGGLGHLGLQYARAMGFRTAVISRGTEKEARAYLLGADLYIDGKACDPAEELHRHGGAKAILATAPDAPAIGALIDGLSRHGRLLLIAHTSEVLPIPATSLMRAERSVCGVTGGAHIDEAIRFARHASIEPIVEVFTLEHAAEAHSRMLGAQLQFRAVLKVGP